MLLQAGLENVQVKAAILALPHGHPYMRLPVQFATSLRQRILGAKLLTESELDEAIAAYEQVVGDPQTFALSFIVTQVWGRKPSLSKFGE